MLKCSHFTSNEKGKATERGEEIERKVRQNNCFMTTATFLKLNEPMHKWTFGLPSSFRFYTPHETRLELSRKTVHRMELSFDTFNRHNLVTAPLNFLNRINIPIPQRALSVVRFAFTLAQHGSNTNLLSLALFRLGLNSSYFSVD